MGIAGLPDLLCCYRGRFLALEIKTPGRETNTSPRQKHWLAKLAKAGAISDVCSSVADAKKHLDTIDQDHIRTETHDGPRTPSSSERASPDHARQDGPKRRGHR